MAVLDAASAVSQLLHAAISAGYAPGFVATWGPAHRPLAVACGWRGLGAGPVDQGVWYDLASLTKPLVVTTLALLARRQGLSLQDPLRRYLPELHHCPWGDVTVSQCLTHTAGFPPWEPLYAGGSLSREGYLEALRRIPAAYPPGASLAYSCLGFIAVGMALERIGKATLDSLFRREILEPLRLGSELGFRPAMSTPVALGEKRFFVEEALCRQRGISTPPPPHLPEVWSCDDGNARGLGGVAGNAGLFGTARGVLRLAAEYLPGGGQLLRGEEAALAVQNWTSGHSQARGLGWQLAITEGSSAGPALSPLAFGHTGFTGTSVWVDPERRAIFVLLGNRLHPGGRTPDFHPLRRRFHTLAVAGLRHLV
ncbi:MAG: serine hydrolase domain-containing protein [Thermoanaerobaculaceae bacterium]